LGAGAATGAAGLGFPSQESILVRLESRASTSAVSY
jgi:hypothetical protein